MADPPINLNFEERYKLNNFMREMTSAVSFRRPPSEDHLWAFWCEPTLSSPRTGGMITEKIKYMLLHFKKKLDHILIQFWAPITTETGCLQIVTSDQPFGLTHLDEGLLKYRKHCLEYKFNVDGEQYIGIPGLAFQQKRNLYTPDVRFYTSKEYPQRNFALTCHISASFAFPVFHTDCVGVLEFVTNTPVKALYTTCYWFLNSLKDAGLKSSLCDWLLYRTFDKGYRYTLHEIYRGLKLVCTTHNLPLAQTWVPCSHFNVVAYVEKSASYVGDDNYVLAKFPDYCILNDLQKGQGVVGRAYQSRKPFFCTDITQFSLIEYPLLPGARYYGLTGCFAICLQCAYTGEKDYILEFFLNPENTYGEDPTTFLCSLLETMKRYFPGYKHASGEQLGNELSIEFIKPPRNQEPASFQCQNTRSSFGPGVLDNGKETMQPPSSNQQQIAEAEQNNTLVSCSDEARMIQEPASFQCQNTRSSSETGALNNGQRTMQPHSSNQQQRAEVVDINNQRNVVNAKQNNTPVFCSDEAITYEKLKIHFGKKLEDVTQIFGVSRSTFKRICRHNRISRWPQGKRNKINNSPSRRDPPCSDMPAEKLVPTVRHMTPLVTPPSEARTITIKATCGDDMLKFQLRFSSRMVDLEEEVSKRRKLDVGTYKIKYTDGDGDQILIACEKDLQDCMSASNSLGMNAIKMLIEPIT